MKISVVENTPGEFSVVKTEGFTPKNYRCSVPPSIASEDYPYVKAQQQIIEDDTIWVAYVDGAAKSAGEAEASKQAQLDMAYSSMNKDIYDKLYDVFRTRKPETATAEHETFKHMKDNPSQYASKGLKCDHQLNKADTTELFSPGSALDTDQKVLDYATRKLELVHEYGVYRAERIQQFKNEKETIENS